MSEVEDHVASRGVLKWPLVDRVDQIISSERSTTCQCQSYLRHSYRGTIPKILTQYISLLLLSLCCAMLHYFKQVLGFPIIQPHLHPSTHDAQIGICLHALILDSIIGVDILCLCKPSGPEEPAHFFVFKPSDGIK